MNHDQPKNFTQLSCSCSMSAKSLSQNQLVPVFCAAVAKATAGGRRRKLGRGPGGEAVHWKLKPPIWRHASVSSTIRRPNSVERSWSQSAPVPPCGSVGPTTNAPRDHGSQHPAAKSRIGCPVYRWARGLNTRALEGLIYA